MSTRENSGEETGDAAGVTRWLDDGGDAGGGAGAIHFRSVAGLIDAVAGVAPKQLQTLLRVLSRSNYRLEARVVVELAMRCRDPLAELSSVCRDALLAASDLEMLLRTYKWHDVVAVCPHARAQALLRLCDEALSEADNPYSAKRRRRCNEIRPRLKQAARAERRKAGALIGRIAAHRDTVCPGYWEVLRAFLVRYRRSQRVGS